jgi:hypothetical protein
MTNQKLSPEVAQENILKRQIYLTVLSISGCKSWLPCGKASILQYGILSYSTKHMLR